MTKFLTFVFLIVLVLFFCMETQARERGKMAYRGFIGGMMLHSGYVKSGEFQVVSHSGETHDISTSGAPFGIGGSIRFLFGKHLRVGAEGYVSNYNYGQYSSHAKIGWGGFLADCSWDLKGCRLFVGGTMGGGSQTNTIVLSPTGGDYKTDDIAYRKYGFAVFTPFAGIEIGVTEKIDIVFKADWLLNLSNRQDDFLSGPRIYLGIMFGHRK